VLQRWLAYAKPACPGAPVLAVTLVVENTNVAQLTATLITLHVGAVGRRERLVLGRGVLDG